MKDTSNWITTGTYSRIPQEKTKNCSSCLSTRCMWALHSCCYIPRSKSALAAHFRYSTDKVAASITRNSTDPCQLVMWSRITSSCSASCSLWNSSLEKYLRESTTNTNQWALIMSSGHIGGMRAQDVVYFITDCGFLFVPACISIFRCFTPELTTSVWWQGRGLLRV